MTTARKNLAGRMEDALGIVLRRGAITPEDMAHAKAARVEALGAIRSALDNMRRLVTVRKALARAGARDEVAGIDAEAADLVRDIDQLLISIGRLDAEAGIKFDGEARRLRAARSEIWEEYRAAMDVRPAKRRKAKESSERVRQLRERRKRGVRYVVPIEITDAHLAAFVEHGLLTPEEAADRKSVSEVIDELVADFLDVSIREWGIEAARTRASKVA